MPKAKKIQSKKGEEKEADDVIKPLDEKEETSEAVGTEEKEPNEDELDGDLEEDFEDDMDDDAFDDKDSF